MPGVGALGNYLSIGEGAGGQGFGDSTSGVAIGDMAEEGRLGLHQGLCQFPPDPGSSPSLCPLSVTFSAGGSRFIPGAESG